MNKVISLITLLAMLLLLGASGTAFAGKIYKWVDSNGEVHYGEHPPGGQGQQISVPHSAPSTATPAPKPSSQMEATQKLLESFDKDRKEKNEAADKAAKEKEMAAKNCSTAKKNVALLKSGGRQYEMTENGERNYLDEATIQTRLKKAQEDVEKWCK